jgi:multidrug resistance efflux pump
VTTDQAAAEATLAAAQADVDRLRAQLSDEQAASAAEPTGPRLASWEDGVAAARARFPGRTVSERREAGSRDTRPQSAQAAWAERQGLDITTVEGAKAEARRRGAARKSNR